MAIGKFSYWQAATWAFPADADIGSGLPGHHNPDQRYTASLSEIMSLGDKHPPLPNKRLV